MSDIISVDLDHKKYKKRKSIVTVLENFSLTVQSGESVAIVGESGSGKSTLLNILGLIDRCYEGSCSLFGKDTKSLSDREAAIWRNRRIGFVLQESALISSISIEENIKLPYVYSSPVGQAGRDRFEDIVNLLGIEKILSKKPLECSGGEKARAVFARGVLTQPELILADEPTASLDADNRVRLTELLFGMCSDFGSTIVTATHDAELANRHDRIVTLKRKD